MPKMKVAVVPKPGADFEVIGASGEPLQIQTVLIIGCSKPFKAGLQALLRTPKTLCASPNSPASAP